MKIHALGITCISIGVLLITAGFICMFRNWKHTKFKPFVWNWMREYSNSSPDRWFRNGWAMLIFGLFLLTIGLLSMFPLEAFH